MSDLFEDFVRRGMAAQQAVDKVIKDSRAKIRLKYAPKQYKSGPTPTGAARLQQRVNRLMLDAGRLARKPVTTLEGEVEQDYAQKLCEALRAFNQMMAVLE